MKRLDVDPKAQQILAGLLGMALVIAVIGIVFPDAIKVDVTPTQVSITNPSPETINTTQFVLDVESIKESVVNLESGLLPDDELDPEAKTALEQFDFYANEGLDYLIKRDQANALTSFKNAYDIDDGNVVITTIIGVILSMSGQIEDAVPFYERATDIDPNYYYGWKNYALNSKELEKYEESVEFYKKATALNPNDEDDWLNMGFSYVHLNQHQNALDSYEKSLHINSKNVIALNGKGVVLNLMRQHEDAIIVFDQVLDIDPNHVNSIINKGRSYEYLGDSDKAMEFFNDALDIDPDNPYAFRGKIRILENTQN